MEIDMPNVAQKTQEALMRASFIQELYSWVLKRYLRERLQLGMSREDNSHWAFDVFPDRVTNVCKGSAGGHDHLLRVENVH